MKKHILCLGDSNTHGYCADPADCADGGIRFNEDERWTCLLQKALGPESLVTEVAECGQPLGRGCLVTSRELPGYYEKTAALVGAHFLNAKDCEFNALDGMHLTRKGHAQLAAMLAEAVPGLL